MQVTTMVRGEEEDKKARAARKPAPMQIPDLGHCNRRCRFEQPIADVLIEKPCKRDTIFVFLHAKEIQ